MYSTFTYIFLTSTRWRKTSYQSHGSYGIFLEKTTNIITYQESNFCKFPHLTTTDRVLGHRVSYIIGVIQI